MHKASGWTQRNVPWGPRGMRLSPLLHRPARRAAAPPTCQTRPPTAPLPLQPGLPPDAAHIRVYQIGARGQGMRAGATQSLPCGCRQLKPQDLRADDRAQTRHQQAPVDIARARLGDAEIQSSALTRRTQQSDRLQSQFSRGRWQTQVARQVRFGLSQTREASALRRRAQLSHRALSLRSEH